MTPSWIGPTIAISLVVIAASFLVMGSVALLVGMGLRRQSRALRAFTDEARGVSSRLKGELEGFADLSADARERLKVAIDSVDTRLRDLDALVEVVQEEAEETALDVASFVRTIRSTGGILGAARRKLRRRRSRE
jgi:uncharacterized protein YoxC